MYIVKLFKGLRYCWITLGFNLYRQDQVAPLLIDQGAFFAQTQFFPGGNSGRDADLEVLGVFSDPIGNLLFGSRLCFTRGDGNVVIQVGIILPGTTRTGFREQVFDGMFQ